MMEYNDCFQSVVSSRQPRLPTGCAGCSAAGFSHDGLSRGVSEGYQIGETDSECWGRVAQLACHQVAYRNSTSGYVRLLDLREFAESG